MEEELEKDMKPKLIGETWRKYPTETSKYKSTYGLYECPYCRKEFEAMVFSIKSGGTKGCGCQRGKGFKHGLESHRFYSTWNALVQRCTNPKNKKYMDYGGRGISVCEEWLDVRNFIAWCELTYPNINNYSIDRIDNYGGYSPENCRWVDKTTQCINQRIKKNNTSGFVGVSYHNGKARWAASVGVNYKTLYIGTFLTKEEAVQARDNYIIENKLPHKLSADYQKD